MTVLEKDNQVIIYLASFIHGFYVSYDEEKIFNNLNEGLEKVNELSIFGIDIVATENNVNAITGRSIIMVLNILVNYMN